MRDHRIDILRFIGLAMIILAHVGPPRLIFEIRNFDVPLMVLVSGMSFELSHKPGEPYGAYVWKRIKRLVFPVWIFLSGYFMVLLAIDPDSPELNGEAILTSYGLIGGIGYVWIIRVFLLVALVSPLLYALHRKIRSTTAYLLTLAGGLALYDTCRYLTLPYIQSGPLEGMSLVSHYLIPYSLVFMAGLRLQSLSKGKAWAFALISLVATLVIGYALYKLNGRFISTQEQKYPPSAYYIAYAMFMAGSLWLISPAIESLLEKAKVKSAFLFVAQNSIWIYLWHIPMVKAIHLHFLPKYFIIFLAATAATYAQVWLVQHLLVRITHSDRLKRNLRTVLTG